MHENAIFSPIRGGGGTSYAGSATVIYYHIPDNWLHNFAYNTGQADRAVISWYLFTTFFVIMVYHGISGS